MIFSPIPAYSHYNASKGRVVSFTRGLSTDLASFGITVNEIFSRIVNAHGAVVCCGVTEERFQVVANMQAMKKLNNQSTWLVLLHFYKVTILLLLRDRQLTLMAVGYALKTNHHDIQNTI